MLLGPLVGVSLYLIAAAVAELLASGPNVSKNLRDLAAFSLFAAPGAYVIGIIPATATGVCAALMGAMGVRGLSYLIACAVTGTLLSALTGALADGEPLTALILSVPGGFAGGICALLSRRSKPVTAQ